MESFYSRTFEDAEKIKQHSKAKFCTKRDGSKQSIEINSIKERLEALCFELETKYLNLNVITYRVVQGLYEGITTQEIDNLAAETCAYMNIIHPHYSILAARIAVNSLHKSTSDSFYQTIHSLFNYEDKGITSSLISDDVYSIVSQNKDRIEAEIKHERDYTYDFFGFKTLEKSYLLRMHGKVVERPQYMLMRVSIGIHKNDLDSVFETYHLMSQRWFTHATPTLYNSGTRNPQMSSCFLLNMQSDSIEGIYDTLKQTALISKSAGGIGLAVHNIRASESYIRGTNGYSNGLVPMLRVFNNTARYVDQGGGKRKGSFAIYLEPWHSDIFDFLQLKKNHGAEENRARDLFYAMWVPDLFMKRVENNDKWTLMCPNECKGLSECYGDEFEKLYEKYERENKGRKTIQARELFQEIIQSQIETGTPYMLYKDACNLKSNQKNLGKKIFIIGTIKSSNLCTEIVQYTSKEEVAVCNLCSINLSKFVLDDCSFDYSRLVEISRILVKNMNRVIDENYYPVKEAQYSNMRNRPIGIGVQGLADCFFKMRVEFESEQAELINEKIFESIYFGAVSASVDLAEKYGHYQTYPGSPTSEGLLQFDLWSYKPRNGYDWDAVKLRMKQFGIRNSLLIAPMPTASTSQILGNNESFEPYTSNLYTRRGFLFSISVLSGEFVCINSHLVTDLIKLNLWNPQIKNKLIQFNGSIQKIEEIPLNIRNLYKTVWEISQKQILNLAAGRSPFIDQSQSLNIHLAEANMAKMSSMHFYAWKKGLKTGLYYLRTKPAADAIKFTLDVETILKTVGDINTRSMTQVKEQKDEAKKEDLNFKEFLQKKKVKYECTDEICTSCGS